MQGLGEKLRQAREGRALSLRELAAMAEVSASMLSQIENGRSNPSVRTLYNVAASLELPVDYFFPLNSDVSPSLVANESQHYQDKTASELRALTVEGPLDHGEMGFIEGGGKAGAPLVLAGQRSQIQLRGGVTWSRLTGAAEKDVEFLEVTYEPGAASGTRMSHHSGREFGLVLSGELTLDLAFDQFVLRAGDSIIFDSTRPHRLTNTGGEQMRAIWVILEQ